MVRLASDKRTPVRRRLAKRHALPAAAVEALSRDPDEGVRRVFRTLGTTSMMGFSILCVPAMRQAAFPRIQPHSLRATPVSKFAMPKNAMFSITYIHTYHTLVPYNRHEALEFEIAMEPAKEKGPA